MTDRTALFRDVMAALSLGERPASWINGSLRDGAGDEIELIASENYTSPRVMEAQGSQLTNKYAEG